MGLSIVFIKAVFYHGWSIIFTGLDKSVYLGLLFG